MLPLSSATTQRKLLSSSKCSFGFKALALEAIFEKLKGVKDFKRWITLMLDEMTCTKELEFCTRTLKWKWIVDFGGDLHIQEPDGMCDHVLVFSAQVFKGTPDAWIQPFAWFGTKGAASGRVLLGIVIKAITKLYEKGAFVKAVVCDGCAPKKSMMTLFEVSGQQSGSSYVTHPIDPNQKIYFVTDVSHLLKSTRNNIYKHKIVQVYFRDKYFTKLITDILILYY